MITTIDTLEARTAEKLIINFGVTKAMTILEDP